jgi:hypothetical protein
LDKTPSFSQKLKLGTLKTSEARFLEITYVIDYASVSLGDGYWHAVVYGKQHIEAITH